MNNASDRKLYLGPRLRVLRRELGLNQTRMAEELGVSPSYLNHLERNQRPLTAQMLLRLANTYDIDLRDFVAGANEAAASDLHEIFTDGLVRDIGIPRHEVMEVAENYPSVAEAVTRLYRALADLRRMPDRIEQLGAASPVVASPLDWLREHVDGHRNHFAQIDQAAEALSAELGQSPETLREGMLQRLQDRYGISVRVMPEDMMVGALRHYDFHRRRLMLSERLPAESRLFGTAYQLALQALGPEIGQAITRADPPDGEAAALARIFFVNYAAAAILMPYGRFLDACMASRHDLDLIANRFQISYEHVAHRLTTLGRNGARGVPFFLLKIDMAGNVSKRFSGEAMPVARFGGGCPRWDVQRAFRLPGETIARDVETPEGIRYVSFARAVPRTAAPGFSAIVIGCEAKHRAQLAAADPIAGPPIPIGPACHLCERDDCTERALPPVTRTLDLHQYRRPVAPYPFRPT